MAQTVQRCIFVGKSAITKNGKCRYGCLVSADKYDGSKLLKDFSCCEFWGGSTLSGIEIEAGKAYYITLEVIRDSYAFVRLQTVADYIQSIQE